VKRILPVLLLLGVLWVGSAGLGFMVFFIPVIWLFSPFHHAPPKGSLQAVTQSYLKFENAAVKKYSGCVLVKSKQTMTNQKTGITTTTYSYSWRIAKVNVPFVQSVMEQESDGSAIAISSAGAFGLMQVTLGKFERDMQKGGSPLDPKTNIMRGVQYLDLMWDQFPGNLQLIAAAYNAGPGVPEQWVAEYHTTDWAQIETHPAVQNFAKGQTYHYVNDVMSFYQQFLPGYSAAETCGPVAQGSAQATSTSSTSHPISKSGSSNTSGHGKGPAQVNKSGAKGTSSTPVLSPHRPGRSLPDGR